MPKRSKIFNTSNSGFKSATVASGQFTDITSDGYRPGTTKSITHDGDTISVFAAGNLNIRFLGIDTPEKSFKINNRGRFLPLDDQKWVKYLDELTESWGDMESTLGEGLAEYIKDKLNTGGVALNHYIHAKRATNKLRDIIQNDMEKLGLNDHTMSYFLPFAYETLDGYQRLLSFVHTDKNNPFITGKITEEESASYNERMLRSGYSLPYFIWPNINPFRKEKSITMAAYSCPEDFREKLNLDRTFTTSRQAVKDARVDKVGIFDDNATLDEQKTGELILDAFELRYLARKEKPSRRLIDLNSDGNMIIDSANYFNVLPEDRLFIPEHFVPLLISKGWQTQS